MAFFLAVTLFLSTELRQPQAHDLVVRMERYYRNSKTLQATFLERYGENGRITRVEAGTVYFRRPGKMRWEYESPEKDLFLVDGKTAWFYVPADHTATRIPAKESTDLRTPLALLAGEMKVSRVCASVEVADSLQPRRTDDAMLKCNVREARDGGAGRSEERSDEIFFEVAQKSGELGRIIVHQAGGIEVEFQFEGWKINPALPADFFRFVPPPGVAIVNGEALAGSQEVPPSRVLNK